MGALHEGHLSLVRRSKAECDRTVMSIFVNPLQFGPKEDFGQYLRPIETDRALAKNAGVDFLFFPPTDEVYAKDRSTHVEETLISRPMEGVFRPDFFRGVCTVVLKLFATVRPDRSYFGQKDAQQLRVIEKMTNDLNLDVTIIGCPTVREKDGLAMSSRNAYLTPAERETAPTLYAGLKKAHDAFERGERSTAKLVEKARKHIDAQPALGVQYLEARRWRDFESVDRISEKSILAAAAYLGKTRLVDNIILLPPS